MELIIIPVVCPFTENRINESEDLSKKFEIHRAAEDFSVPLHFKPVWGLPLRCKMLMSLLNVQIYSLRATKFLWKMLLRETCLLESSARRSLFKWRKNQEKEA